MAQVATIFIFCVVLVNIYACDHVKTRHAPVVRHAQQTHVIKTRGNNETDQNCTCEDEDTVLTFVFNSTTGIIGINDGVDGICLVIDPKSNLFVIVDEESLTTIIINYRNQSQNLIFNSTTKITFDYLIHLKSLQTVYNSGKKNGTSFNTSSIPAEISKQLAPILKVLLPNSPRLSDLIKLVQSLASIFTTYGKIFGNGGGAFRGDLGSLIQRFVGLSNLFNISGGFSALGGGNFTLNLGSFLRQRTGLEAFINLIKQLSGSFDLRKLLGSNLGSSEALLSLISAFGGSARFDQILHIIAQLGNLAQNNSSNGTNALPLVNATFQIVISVSNTNITIQQWQSIMQNATYQLGNPGQNNSLSGLADLLRNLSSQSFSINGIDFSGIIQNLLNPNPRGVIYNIIYILNQFRVRFPLQQSIPHLMVQIFSLFISPNRITIIRNLFSMFSECQLKSLFDTWRGALRSVIRFLKLEQNFFDGMAKFWLQIPGIGLFFGPIDEALSLYTQGVLTIVKIFASEDARRIFLEGISSLVDLSGGGQGDIAGEATGILTDLGSIFGGGSGNGNDNDTDSDNGTESSSAGGSFGGLFNFREHPKPITLQKKHNHPGNEKKNKHHH